MCHAMESLKIILLCIVAAIVYGVLHDQVTARVCVEYFTIGHPPVFHTDSPTLLAFGWGVVATWWMGLILSIPAVLASRIGSWPKLAAVHLVRPIGHLLIVMAVSSLLAGIAGYFTARAGGAWLVGSLALRIPAAKHVTFVADLWAHSAAYGVGFFGGLVVCGRIVMRRRRLAKQRHADSKESVQRHGTRTLRRAILSLGGFSIFLAVVMFLSAGIGWRKGWVFLLVFLLQRAMASVYLWRNNPAIVLARRKIHAGTKGWDKDVLFLVILSFVAIFPVAGLDSRFHWSSVPSWSIVLGYVLYSIGMLGSTWVQAVNKFAERSVRIQPEQKVVDTGPYAVVRHPFYVAAFFMFGGIPLALGSLWALIPVAVAILILVVRTVFEDRMLQRELEGYKEYAGRVRYRLIPGVW